MTNVTFLEEHTSTVLLDLSIGSIRYHSVALKLYLYWEKQITHCCFSLVFIFINGILLWLDDSFRKKVFLNVGGVSDIHFVYLLFVLYILQSLLTAWHDNISS